MDQTKLSYDQVKQQILDIGQGVLCRRGFIGVGLAEILDACGVPKGSFYHYFKSKEMLGVALVEHYTTRYMLGLNNLSNTIETSGYDRLSAYWDHWVNVQTGEDETRKCLLIRLCTEMEDLSEAMQGAVQSALTAYRGWIARTVDEGLRDGSMHLQEGLTCEQAAEEILHIWLGASVFDLIRKDGRSFVLSRQQSDRLLGVASRGTI